MIRDRGAKTQGNFSDYCAPYDELALKVVQIAADYYTVFYRDLVFLLLHVFIYTAVEHSFFCYNKPQFAHVIMVCTYIVIYYYESINN